MVDFLPNSSLFLGNSVSYLSFFTDQVVFQFGSRKLTGEILKTCRHSGALSALTGDLLTALFSAEEMALGSLTGKPPNAFNTYVEKQKLDETVIEAIASK